MKRRSFIKLFASVPVVAAGVVNGDHLKEEKTDKPVRVLITYDAKFDSHIMVTSVSTKYEKYSATGFVEDRDLYACADELKDRLLIRLERDGVTRDKLIYLPMPSGYTVSELYNGFPEYLSL